MKSQPPYPRIELCTPAPQRSKTRILPLRFRGSQGRRPPSLSCRRSCGQPSPSPRTSTVGGPAVPGPWPPGEVCACADRSALRRKQGGPTDVCSLPSPLSCSRSRPLQWAGSRRHLFTRRLPRNHAAAHCLPSSQEGGRGGSHLAGLQAAGKGGNSSRVNQAGCLESSQPRRCLESSQLHRCCRVSPDHIYPSESAKEHQEEHRNNRKCGGKGGAKIVLPLTNYIYMPYTR